MAHYGEIPLRRLQALAEDKNAAFAHNPDEISRLLAESGLFDADFYGIRYPDVASAGLNALDHYIRHGWREGRNPNLWFDSDFYLADNPDIAPRLANPLLHYGRIGYKEGRRPNPEHSKRRNRQVLVVLAQKLPLHQIILMLHTLPGHKPDAIVVAIEQPDVKDLGNLRALHEIFRLRAQIRPYARGEEANALMEIMADHEGDALILMSPLAGNIAERMAALRAGWSAGSGVLALQCAYGVFEDGALGLTREKPEEKRSFPIPLVQYGALIPPGVSRSLIANAPLYLKYAPNFPAVWLAVQTMLDRRALVETGGEQGATRSSLDRLGTPEFRKQLEDTMACFRRELGKTMGINILEQLFKKDLNMKYRNRAGRELEWDNLQTYGEKLQYLKLYADMPLQTIAADKYRSRKYARAVTGSDYSVPLLGVWKSFDDIDFSRLPEQFVLKASHGSGQNMIVRHKASFDIEAARRKFLGWESYSPRDYGHEYNYFDIEPLLICEPFLEENISDYQVFCFSGKPEFVRITTDKYIDQHFTLFTTDWKLMDAEYSLNSSTKRHFPRPKKLNLMFSLASKLSAPFSHARIDFFILKDDSLMLGEITFFSGSGFTRFNPDSYDKYLGSLINLPNPN